MQEGLESGAWHSQEKTTAVHKKALKGKLEPQGEPGMLDTLGEYLGT